MLTDPVEIAIIAKARQKNVRDPGRSRQHFETILRDFFAGVTFEGQRCMDLGPGQFDFGVLARARGADVTGIDNDAAVVELGRYKGFKVIEGTIQRLAVLDHTPPYDGMFCKYSINAFWFWEDEALQRDAVRTIVGRMKPTAWGWLAPWNGVPKSASLTPSQIDAVLDVQIDEFTRHGFEAFELTEAQSRDYGVHGTTANRVLFTRNLRVPEHLRS
jgi:hypothetical protein